MACRFSRQITSIKSIIYRLLPNYRGGHRSLATVLGLPAIIAVAAGIHEFSRACFIIFLDASSRGTRVAARACDFRCGLRRGAEAGWCATTADSDRIEAGQADCLRLLRIWRGRGDTT